MCWPTYTRLNKAAAGIAAALALGAAAAAQESWPTYHGDFTGQRHSKLTQITPANVTNLSLAWAFQTNQTAARTATMSIHSSHARP